MTLGLPKSQVEAIDRLAQRVGVSRLEAVRFLITSGLSAESVREKQLESVEEASRHSERIMGETMGHMIELMNAQVEAPLDPITEAFQASKTKGGHSNTPLSEQKCSTPLPKAPRQSRRRKLA